MYKWMSGECRDLWTEAWVLPPPPSRLTGTSSHFQCGSSTGSCSTSFLAPEQTLLDTFSSAYIIWRLVMYEDGGLDAADPVSHCSGVRAAYAPGASWVIWGYLKNLGSFMCGLTYKSIKKQTSRSDKSDHGC